MSSSLPIGASSPPSFLTQLDAAGGTEDTDHPGSLRHLGSRLHEMDTRSCAGTDKPHAMPYPAGILHPAVFGTQVGSEG